MLATLHRAIDRGEVRADLDLECAAAAVTDPVLYGFLTGAELGPGDVHRHVAAVSRYLECERSEHEAPQPAQELSPIE